MVKPSRCPGHQTAQADSITRTGFEPRSGSYVDSLPLIWRRYMTSPTLFWLDALTSIPVSFLELSLSQARTTHTPHFKTSTSTGCIRTTLTGVINKQPRLNSTFFCTS